MSLGFGEVKLAVVGDLMERTCSTWLYSITLAPALIRFTIINPSMGARQTLTLRALHGLHDS